MERSLGGNPFPGAATLLYGRRWRLCGHRGDGPTSPDDATAAGIAAEMHAGGTGAPPPGS